MKFYMDIVQLEATRNSYLLIFDTWTRRMLIFVRWDEDDVITPVVSAHAYHGVTHCDRLHAFNVGLASPDNMASNIRLSTMYWGGVHTVVAYFRDLSPYCFYRPRKLRNHGPECPILLTASEPLFLCITGYRDRIFAFSFNFFMQIPLWCNVFCRQRNREANVDAVGRPDLTGGASCLARSSLYPAVVHDSLHPKSLLTLHDGLPMYLGVV
jgi:hypothetical protein